MRRSPVLLLLCLLALATGLACLRVAAFVAPPALPPPPPDRIAAAHVALVHRFYTAVNQALETGETTLLEVLVADDLIEHPAPAGTAFGRGAFVQHLLALRTLYPDLQFVIDDLQATADNQVTARLQTTGHESGTFLGLPLPPGMLPWPPLEEFRIAEDRIVERWGGTEALVQLEPLFASTQPVLSSGTAYVQLARVTYPPRSPVPLGTDQTPRLSYLEAGAVTLREGPGGDDARTAGMLLPTAPGLTAQTEVPDPTIVLEVMITGTSPNVINPLPKRGHDVHATLLATAIIPVDAWPGMAVAAGRVTLAPGATLAFPAAAGPMLLAVEAGELELTASAGRTADPGAWVVDSQVNRSPTDDPFSTGRSVAAPIQNQAPVPVGGVALVEANAQSLWHNPGSRPATVLVLKITPSGEEPPIPLGA